MAYVHNFASPPIMMYIERRRRIAVLSFAVLVFGMALVIVFNVYLLSSVQSNKSNVIMRIDPVALSMHDVKASAARPRRHQIKIVREKFREQLTNRWTNLMTSTNDSKWTMEKSSLNSGRVEIEERAPNLRAPDRSRTSLPVDRQWAMAGNWVQARQTYPANESDNLTDVLNAIAMQPIIKAEVLKRGTQLKVLLLLKGGQRAVMKVMRYSRETMFVDTPYSGADRHNGEIAAFHLSRLLNFRWCPLASGRLVDLKREILPVAEKRLSETFFTKNHRTCFYGVCRYCRRDNAVCASSNGTLEAALILWLPVKYQLKMHTHPWGRTYKSNIKAAWEKSDDYCHRIRKSSSYKYKFRLLDLIDVSIFDFLTGNADRHLYETFKDFNNSAVILVDNGKSFGNPYADEVTILAPLYQCCVVRSSTVDTLRRFPGRALSSSLEKLLKMDPLYPILTEAHLYALDRRRYKVLDAIDWCQEQNPKMDVMIMD